MLRRTSRRFVIGNDFTALSRARTIPVAVAAGAKQSVFAGRPAPSRIFHKNASRHKQNRAYWPEGTRPFFGKKKTPWGGRLKDGTQAKKFGGARQRTAWPHVIIDICVFDALASSRERRVGGAKFFCRRWDPSFSLPPARAFIFFPNSY